MDAASRVFVRWLGVALSIGLVTLLAVGCASILSSPTENSVEVMDNSNGRPFEVQSVSFDMGEGSPLPVNAQVAGSWPSMCSQLSELSLTIGDTGFDYQLKATESDEGCPPDNVGLPFRLAIPLNMVEQPAGTYMVSINGQLASFDWQTPGAPSPMRIEPGTVALPVKVQDVQVEIGVGSPIPVEVIVAGEWPGLCAQLTSIKQSRHSNEFSFELLAAQASDCRPDNVGLPFRMALPLNMIRSAAGTYTATVNGVSTDFAWPRTAAEQESQEQEYDGWSLAFIGTNGNVVILPAGSEARVLTNDGTPPNTNFQDLEVVVLYNSPKISSDGSLVAVRRDEGLASASGIDFSFSLIVLDTVSGESRLVVDDMPAGFDWKPSSQQLAFAVGPDEEYFSARGQVDSDRAQGMMIYDYETNTVSELVGTNRGFSLVAPTWSPDGRYLAFNELNNYEGSGLFAFYDLQFGEYIAWERAIGLYDWSPTGERLAYDMLTYTPIGEERIYMNDLGGGTEYELTPANIQGYAFNPSWSPDGAWIAYFVGVPDSMTYELRVQPVNGSEPMILGEFESVTKPAWTADGSRLIFGAGQHPFYDILAVDALDGTVANLAQGFEPSLAAGG